MQPPQNPYSNPGQPSPGQPNLGQPNLGQPAPVAGATVSLDNVGRAWAALKPNLGTWLAVAVVYVIISSVLNSVLGRAFHFNPRSFGVTPSSLGFRLISAIVTTFLSAMLFKVAIGQIRTGRADFGEMFNIFDNAGALALAAVLSSIIISIGFVLLIIPGIIAALGLGMVIPLVIDGKLDALSALQRSWEVMKNHLLSYFVLGLVLVLVNILGACACGVGLLVTIPLSFLTLALVYRDLFLGNISAPTMPNFPPPPIANPNG